MYGIVMMMAMTGAPDATAFGHRHGCSGCSGSCYGSCYGGGCSGCYGGGCSGCYGGGHHRGHRHGCHGCSGGCYGSCYGGSGCYGSCYGGSGCTGWSAGCDCGGMAVNPGATMMTPPPPPPPAEGEKKMTTPPPPPTAAAPGTTATLVVSLPADAALTVNDLDLGVAGSARTFVTPAVRAGRYYYDFKITAERDGASTVASRRVFFTPGQTVNVALDFPAPALAQR